MDLKEPRRSIATISPGEMEAYAVLFIGPLIAGNVIWVVYEVIYATGSPVDTIHSIVTNLWQASAAALFFTLTAAGISKGIGLTARRLRQWLFKSREGWRRNRKERHGRAPGRAHRHRGHYWRGA